jgi:hypothetical protein
MRMGGVGVNLGKDVQVGSVDSEICFKATRRQMLVMHTLDKEG